MSEPHTSQSSNTQTAAIIGTGVIGAGWVVRFLLHGFNVVVFDPSSAAKTRTRDMLKRVQPHVQALYDHLLPTAGTLSFAATAAEAVSGAHWVQESLPEELTIKQQIYAEIAPHLSPSTPLASSTSGFKPSELALGFACAEQLLVAHPFNPVYLLPAVEIVPGTMTRPEITARAMTVMQSIGMKPVHVRKEIDAHIADRLLEALWREALWLVADDIATTQEIDDVMRHGFGLRWAQMGLFETYRIAGGDKGMHHFMSQFGPALAWPWSKLTDVPELNQELIDKIAHQSDLQANGKSILALEEERDANLVGILKALKTTNSGAGAVLNDMDNKLSEA